MDFSLTPEQEAFRAEVRAWLSANLPPDWATRPIVSDVPRAELYEFGRQWQRKLHEAGLLGLTWPKEYGGRGLSWMEELLLHEELVLHRAPPPLNILGLGMAGPTIIAYGTDAQKQRHLQKILTCEEIWCQGYSEPNAGSDLAGLQTRAVKDGDHYVVNGQKVWTSLAQISDWMMLLARTDPSVAEAQGAHLLPPRHALAGDHRAPAPPAHRRRRVQRGVPRERPRAGGEHPRRGGPGLAGGPHDAHVRAAGARVRAPGPVRDRHRRDARAGPPDVARGSAGGEGPGAAPAARAAGHRQRRVQVHGQARDHEAPAGRDAGVRGLRRERSGGATATRRCRTSPRSSWAPTGSSPRAHPGRWTVATGTTRSSGRGRTRSRAVPRRSSGTSWPSACSACRRTRPHHGFRVQPGTGAAAPDGAELPREGVSLRIRPADDGRPRRHDRRVLGQARRARLAGPDLPRGARWRRPGARRPHGGPRGDGARRHARPVLLDRAPRRARGAPRGLGGTEGGVAAPHRRRGGAGHPGPPRGERPLGRRRGRGHRQAGEGRRLRPLGDEALRAGRAHGGPPRRGGADGAPDEGGSRPRREPLPGPGGPEGRRHAPCCRRWTRRGSSPR